MQARRLLKKVVAFLLLALVASLFVPRVVGSGDGDHHGNSVRSELATYKSMLERFRLDCGRYPTTAEGLNALHVAPVGLRDKWGPQPYTDKMTFDDPWGNPYLYLSNEPNRFTLKSYGEDGQPGGNGYAADVEAEP